jgi:predicted HTH transcriptional regulator
MSIQDTSKLHEAIKDYVVSNGKITNRECRKLLSVSYNEAIRLLGSLCDAGILIREGVFSGTKYVLHTNNPEKIDSEQ